MSNKVLLIALLFFLVACNYTNDNDSIVNFKSYNLKKETVDYAKGFKIFKGSEYSVLQVYNPWQGAKGDAFTYIITQNSAGIPKKLKKYPIIKKEIQSVVCLSTTHIALIDALDKINIIKGVSGAQYIHNKKIQEKISLNEIVDVGSPENLDYEQIIKIKPDVVFVYSVDKQTAGFVQKLNDFNIPVVFVADYLETDPLGKAEWIKFFAAFIGKEISGNDKYKAIKDEYLKLRQITRGIAQKPTVFCNIPWKETWYVPGGKSYMAQMIKDAGGKYIWANDSSKDVISLNFEQVLLKAKNTDIWLHVGNLNAMADIEATDERMTLFNAFKSNEIYNNNARQTIKGGNDFWESGIIKPHIILKDLISILHPGFIDNKQPYFYKKLN